MAAYALMPAAVNGDGKVWPAPDDKSITKQKPRGQDLLTEQWNVFWIATEPNGA